MNKVMTENLWLLSNKNIEFEVKLCGSKKLACVKLKNGKTAMFCPMTCNTRYGNKKFNTTSVASFIRFLDRLNNVNSN